MRFIYIYGIHLFGKHAVNTNKIRSKSSVSMKINSYVSRITLALICLLSLLFGTTAFAGSRLKSSPKEEVKRFEPTGLCLKPQHGVPMAVVFDGDQYTVYYQEGEGLQIGGYNVTDKGLEIKTQDGKGSFGVVYIPEIKASEQKKVEIKPLSKELMDKLKKQFPSEEDRK